VSQHHRLGDANINPTQVTIKIGQDSSRQLASQHATISGTWKNDCFTKFTTYPNMRWNTQPTPQLIRRHTPTRCQYFAQNSPDPLWCSLCDITSLTFQFLVGWSGFAWRLHWQFIVQQFRKLAEDCLVIALGAYLSLFHATREVTRNTTLILLINL